MAAPFSRESVLHSMRHCTEELQRVFCALLKLELTVIIFFLSFSPLFSSNRVTAPIRSSSRDVRMLLDVGCLSPFHVLDFEAYFAPTSRSRMSKIFGDSEFLGEQCWK